MAFFNFNVQDQNLISQQIEVLKKKYDKHRKSNLSQIDKERKIRGYVLEALSAYKYKPGQKLSDHPAKEILNRMIGYLDYAGYVIKVNPERSAITILSNRNTYITREIEQDTHLYPECCGGLLNAIKYAARHGEPIGDWKGEFQMIRCVIEDPAKKPEKFVTIGEMLVARAGNSMTWHYHVTKDGLAVIFRIDQNGKFHFDGLTGPDVKVGDEIWIKARGNQTEYGIMEPPRDPFRKVFWEAGFPSKKQIFHYVPEEVFRGVLERIRNENVGKEDSVIVTFPTLLPPLAFATLYCTDREYLKYRVDSIYVMNPHQGNLSIAHNMVNLMGLYLKASY